MARACNTILILFHWAKSPFICPQIKQKKIAEGRQKPSNCNLGNFCMSDETRFSAMFSGSQRTVFNELSQHSANLHTKTISPYEEETLAERKGEHCLTKRLDPICKTSTPSMQTTYMLENLHGTSITVDLDTE